VSPLCPHFVPINIYIFGDNKNKCNQSLTVLFLLVPMSPNFFFCLALPPARSAMKKPRFGAAVLGFQGSRFM
jgi:hypothetical protein